MTTEILAARTVMRQPQKQGLQLLLLLLVSAVKQLLMETAGTSMQMVMAASHHGLLLQVLRKACQVFGNNMKSP